MTMSERRPLSIDRKDGNHECHDYHEYKETSFVGFVRFVVNFRNINRFFLRAPRRFS